MPRLSSLTSLLLLRKRKKALGWQHRAAVGRGGVEEVLCKFLVAWIIWYLSLLLRYWMYFSEILTARRLSLCVAALRLLFSAHFVPPKYTFKRRKLGAHQVGASLTERGTAVEPKGPRTHTVTKGKRVRVRERQLQSRASVQGPLRGHCSNTRAAGLGGRYGGFSDMTWSGAAGTRGLGDDQINVSAWKPRVNFISFRMAVATKRTTSVLKAMKQNL